MNPKLKETIKLTDTDEEIDKIEEKPKQKKPALAKPNGVPRPPEGYIHWSDLTKEYPRFVAEYAGRSDVKISIWIDEEAPLKAILQSVCKTHSTNVKTGESNSREAVVVSDIPNRREYSISVTDLFMLMGDPGFHLEARQKPEDVTCIVDAYWKARKQDCLRAWRRDILGKPRPGFDRVKQKEQIAAGAYDETTCNIEANNEYGYWGTLPNLYLVTPDKLTMTITAGMDIVDFTIQSMEESGISLSKNHFTQTEMQTIKQCLISKAREYQIEGLLKSETIAMTIVQANMLAAVEKNKTQR